MGRFMGGGESGREESLRVGCDCFYFVCLLRFRSIKKPSSGTEMTKAFDSIKQGLKEAIAHKKSNVAKPTGVKLYKPQPKTANELIVEWRSRPPRSR